MKADSNKCHLIVNKKSCMILKIGKINIENRIFEKLGVELYDKRNSNKHP